MCPHIYAQAQALWKPWYFSSVAIYLRTGVKEMVVCKVLPQGIPGLNKTNFKWELSGQTDP